MRALLNRVLECADSSALWLLERCGLPFSTWNLAGGVTTKGKAAMNRRTPKRFTALAIILSISFVSCSGDESELRALEGKLEAANAELVSLKEELDEAREASVSTQELAREVAERLDRVDSKHAELVEGEAEIKEIVAQIAKAEEAFASDLKEIIETKKGLLSVLQHSKPQYTSPEDYVEAVDKIVQENFALKDRIRELEGGSE